jgi:hypothetical protein
MVTIPALLVTLATLGLEDVTAKLVLVVLLTITEPLIVTDWPEVKDTTAPFCTDCDPELNCKVGVDVTVVEADPVPAIILNGTAEEKVIV